MATAVKDDKYDFDLFTIGGGTGGVRAARFAALDYGMFQACCATLLTPPKRSTEHVEHTMTHILSGRMLVLSYR